MAEISQEDIELFNTINNTVTPGKSVVDPSDVELYDRINAGQYETIINDEIGTDPNNVPGISNEREAMAFAGTMGMLDTYRGIKQYFNIDEEQMRMDQKKLNAIFRNKDYGGKAFATYMGGIIADPAGWVIPLAKAKSVASMVKQGVAYGTGLGAASYVDEDMGLTRLEQAGLGAIGGGVITGTLGLAARRWAGFDTPAVTRKEQLEELPSKNLQIEQTRTKALRRQDAELARLTSTEEKLTAIQSYKKNVAIPTWEAWVRNPMRPIGMATGGYVAYNMLDLIPEEQQQTSTDFLRNVALVTVGIAAGKKSGDFLNRTEFVNKAIHGIAPDSRMHPELLKAARQLDGRVASYHARLAALSNDVSKLNDGDKKILYNLMSGDLGRDELLALSKNEMISRQQRIVPDINPKTKKPWTKSEISQLPKTEQLAFKNKAMENKNIFDFLGIGLPVETNKLLKMKDEQVQIMKEIGEDLRLSGLIDDATYKTNIDTFISRNYDAWNQILGPKKANKITSTLDKIKGDGLFSRGVVYNLGNKATFTKDELVDIVPALRAERKYDYRINQTYGKIKDNQGNILNRIDDVADPQYNKALTPAKQASNFGVVIRKSKDKPEEYEIITQLSKEQRKFFKETEDVSFSLAKTALELRTTAGIGKFYASLYEQGINKGFVLDSNTSLLQELNRKGLTIEAGAGKNGRPVIDTAETVAIKQQMLALRTQDPTLPERLRTGQDAYGQPLGRFPYINQGRYAKLQKELTEKQDAAYKEYLKIQKENEAKFKNATVDNPFPKEITLADGSKITEDFVYVPKITEPDPTGTGKAVTKIGGEGGTSIPTYGKLNGTLVRKQEYLDMQLLKSLRENDGSRFMGEGFFKLNSFWKKTKTVYNPAVHVNNYVSNYALYYGGNGAWKQLGKVHIDGTIGQILGFERGVVKWDDLDDDLKHMYKNGVFGRDLISAELKANEAEQIAKLFKVKNAEVNGNWLSDAINTIDNQVSKAKIFNPVVKGGKKVGTIIDEKVSAYYQLEDRLFRVALYRSRLNQVNPATGVKYTRDEAATDAIKQFVDYNIKSKFINATRATFVPFLSYSYRIIPRLAEIGVKHPEKVAVIAALGYAANDIGRMATGATRDEVERERKFMQEYNKQNMFGLGAMPEANIRIKGGDKPKYFNFSRMLPGGDVFMMGGATPGQVPYAPRFVQPGGPAYGSALRAVGIDPFTLGSTQTDEAGMSRTEIGLNRAGKILKDFIPNIPMLPGSFSTAKINRAYERAKDDGPNYNTLDDPLTTTEAWLNSFGFKINTADINRLRRFTSSEMIKLQSDFSAKRKKLNNDRMKGKISYDEYLEEVQILKLDLKEALDDIKERE